MDPGVFLDRDDTLIPAPGSGRHPAGDVSLLPGVVSACGRLRAAGYRLVLVTNQPDVARGRVAYEDVRAVNARLADRLHLDAVVVCIHDDADRCRCRKPRSGMIIDAAAARAIDLHRSVVVGDREVDVLAGRAAGTATVRLAADPATPTSAERLCPGLSEAADWILSHPVGGCSPARLPIDLHVDSADLAVLAAVDRDHSPQGFTTNPSLLRAAGIDRYRPFAEELLALAGGRPVSLEVLSDDPRSMVAEARELAGWSPAVLVKVPVVDTSGRPLTDVHAELAAEGIPLNVTAISTLAQVEATLPALVAAPRALVSVIAGRVADTGRDPVPLVAACVDAAREVEHVGVLWASTREVLNVRSAMLAGARAITIPPRMFPLVAAFRRPMPDLSTDLVRSFHEAGTGLSVGPDGVHP